jgi:hypothetical protein
MKRIALGAVAGLAVWFGSALAAEAQQITPTGPMNIYTGSTSATYSANITLPSLQDYAVQLFVYRNGSQTPLWSCEMWFYGPTDLNNIFNQLVTWGPAAITGEKFTFKANLVLTNPVQVIPATNWVKSVTKPTTYLEPSKPLDMACVAIDRDRRDQA